MRRIPHFSPSAPAGGFIGHRLVAPVGVFLLTTGLAACDPPVAGNHVAKVASVATTTGIATLPRTQSGRVQSRMSDPQPDPIFAPDLGAGVSDVEILPLATAEPDGNAILELRFRQEARPAQEQIELLIDGRRTTLVRDAGDPLLFVGMVFFDVAAFEREQAERAQLIQSSGDNGAAVFEGREFKDVETFTYSGTATSQKSLRVTSRLRLPRSLVSMPPAAVDPARELFITDLSVVQDPTRTFDVCNNVGNPNGAWTFKTLMTNMANQPLTGIDPAVFVENWVRTWQVNHTINTFPVPARPNIGPQVINNWPRLPDGRLNLDRSPFRLLAIVNRVDLRDNPVYGGTGGNAGEGRLVFGVVNRSVNGGCSSTQFTVIFEYGVPISGCSAVQSYAQRWVNLGNLPFSPVFNTELQRITDIFTSANAAPTRPNGSALNQLRSNEISLAAPWELREFVLPRPSGFLNIVSTKETPHRATYQNSANLANYMNSGTASVPVTWLGLPFLTGSSLNPNIADPAAWNAPGATNADRHRVSLNTCDGCHGSEARANGNPFVPFGTPETSFVHVTPRLSGQQSQLSKFLLGTGTLAAPATFPKNDPINGVPQRQFGDLLRRQQDLANLMNTSCSATGLVHALRFSRLRASH